MLASIRCCTVLLFVTVSTAAVAQMSYQPAAPRTLLRVDSIEHGSYINDEDIAMMKKHGTYLVPTAYLYVWYSQYGNLPSLYKQKMIDTAAVARANHKHAIQSGVKVALGTDSAVYPHGLNAHELDVYVNQYGMTPLAAIQSTTLNAVDLMGWSAKTGSLDPGKWADIIAVQGDPLADIKILQQISFVMKAGIIYKNLAQPGVVDHLVATTIPVEPAADQRAF